MVLFVGEDACDLIDGFGGVDKKVVELTTPTTLPEVGSITGRRRQPRAAGWWAALSTVLPDATVTGPVT